MALVLKKIIHLRQLLWRNGFSQPTLLESHMALLQVPDALLPIQFPANMLRKAAEDGLSTWVPAAAWETWLEFQTP